MSLFLLGPQRVGPILGVAAAAIICGCATSSDPDHRLLTAVVYGSVTRSSGSPVAGARVSGVSYAEGCSGRTVAGALWTVTDAQGSYRIQLRDITIPRSMCVAVLVVPDGAGGRDTVTVTGPTLAFRYAQFGEPEDSARVDVRLQN